MIIIHKIPDGWTSKLTSIDAFRDVVFKNLNGMLGEPALLPIGVPYSYA